MVFAQRNCVLVETWRERNRRAVVVLIALITALLLAAPASAQVFPVPPTAQHVICDSGCGSPPASADGATFTAGMTNVSLIGAAFDDAVADLVAGTYGAPRLTAKRAFHVNLRTAAGVEIGTVAAPIFVTPPANQSVNIAQVAGTNIVTGGVAGIIAVGGNVANAVAATANPVPVGGIFTTTPATLASGQTATMQFTAAQNLKHDLTTVAGTAPTTAGKLDVKGADGDVFVRQTTAANLNAAVVGTGTAGAPAGNILTIQGVAAMTKLLVTPDSVALPANQSVNVAQIAGTNTVTGGVAGIIAVGGNVANAVAATANPVPVGGIFTTTPATLATGQTATMQFTAAQNLKHDITTVAGTAPTTAGKLDVKGADGDVFVRQTTAANLNATVTQLAITKGTQAATGVTTQDLHDAGRTAISFYANNFASGATTVEKIITWDQSKGTGAITAATASYTITNGKTLRITELSVGTRGHLTATAQTTTFALRLNTAGACVVTSTPILFAAQSATPATALAWDRVILPIPDGYEIAGNGTIALCMTGNATFATNAPTWAVNLVGYEY